VKDPLPFSAALEFSNRDSPSVGEYRLQADLADRNLTGWGDELRVMAATTLGLFDTEVGYEIPVTAWDTTLGAWFRYGRSRVVEQPFRDLDIDSRAFR
jgi:hemolysin activation/secretion protein